MICLTTVMTFASIFLNTVHCQSDNEGQEICFQFGRYTIVEPPCIQQESIEENCGKASNRNELEKLNRTIYELQGKF